MKKTFSILLLAATIAFNTASAAFAGTDNDKELDNTTTYSYEETHVVDQVKIFVIPAEKGLEQAQEKINSWLTSLNQDPNLVSVKWNELVKPDGSIAMIFHFSLNVRGEVYSHDPHPFHP